MKSIIVLAALTTFTAHANMADDIYFKVGIAYKVGETDLYFKGKRFNEPLAARLELGVDNCIIKRLTCGVAHYSQWLTGWPVNNDKEYNVNHIFIDYKITLGDILN